MSVVESVTAANARLARQVESLEQKNQLLLAQAQDISRQFNALMQFVNDKGLGDEARVVCGKVNMTKDVS